MTRIYGDPRFHTNQAISMRELQRVADLADRNERVDLGNGLNGGVGDGGFSIHADSEAEWWITLTDRNSSTPGYFYSWQLMRKGPLGLGWVADPNGPTGLFSNLPAVELNQNENVPVSPTYDPAKSVVRRAWLGEDGESVYFDYIGGSPADTTTPKTFAGPLFYPQSNSTLSTGPITLNTPTSPAIYVQGVPGTTVAGLLAPLSNGQRVLIANTGTNSIPLTQESLDTAPANRLLCPYSIDQWLFPDFWAELQYDLAIARWRVMFVTDVPCKGLATQGVSGTQHNFGLDVAYPELVLTLTGNTTFTGFEGLKKGQSISIYNGYNSGPYTATINHQDGGSLAANRVNTPGGAPFKILRGGGVRITYDGTFYRVVATRELIGVTEVAYGDSAGAIISTPDFTRPSTANVRLALENDAGTPGLTFDNARSGGADLIPDDVVGNILADGRVDGLTASLGKWEFNYQGDGTTADAGFTFWTANDAGGLVKALEGFPNGTVRISQAQTVDCLLGTSHTTGIVVNYSLGTGLAFSGSSIIATGTSVPALTSGQIPYGSPSNLMTSTADFRRDSEALVTIKGLTTGTASTLRLHADNGAANFADGVPFAYLYMQPRSGGSIQGGVEFAAYKQAASSDTADALVLSLGQVNTATNVWTARSSGKFKVNSLTASKHVVTDANNNLDTVSTIPSTDITGLGTAAPLAADDDTLLAANSATRLPTQHAVKVYVDTAVTGLLDLKGSTNASGNPNYPAGSKGDFYYVTTAGKIGGASGKAVDIGDVYVASADNAGGTEASVGTSWFVLEHNLQGALLSANNFSDVGNVGTARTNLGLGTAATQNSGTSGHAFGFLDGANLWSATQTISKNAGTLPAPPTGTVLHLSEADGVSGTLLLDAFANGCSLNFRRAANTAAAPGAVVNGAGIGLINWMGYGSTAYGTARASIKVTAAENWTDTAQGVFVSWFTTGVGGTTLTERMRMDSNGKLGIGPASVVPLYRFHVQTNAASDSGIVCDHTATSGTNYAIMGNAFGVGATANIGVYAYAQNGTSNYGVYIDAITTSANNWALYSNCAAKSYIQGNLGIGTASPTDSVGMGAALDVNGTNGSGIYARYNGSSTVYAMLGQDSGSSYVYTKSTPLKFYTNGGIVGQFTTAGSLIVGVTDDGANLFQVNGSARMTYPVITRTSAPADAALSSSQLVIWLDATPGATKIMFKAKDSGGTVRTGSVSLT